MVIPVHQVLDFAFIFLRAPGKVRPDVSPKILVAKYCRGVTFSLVHVKEACGCLLHVWVKGERLSVAKGTEPSLRVLLPTSEKCMDLHSEYTVSQIRTVGNPLSQTT